MKRLFAFLFLFSMASLLIISCKDDDENPANALIGTWKFVSYVASGCTNPDDNENSSCSTDCDTFIFTADKLTIKASGDPDETLTYTIKGNEITITDSGIPLTLAFVVSGSTLTLSNSENGCDIIRTLTKV